MAEVKENLPQIPLSLRNLEKDPVQDYFLSRVQNSPLHSALLNYLFHLRQASLTAQSESQPSEFESKSESQSVRQKKD